MLKDKETSLFKTYLLSISLIIALAMSSLFLGMTVKARALIYDSMLVNSRTNFNLVVAMRKWNAGYGGIYVEKRRGVISNPFLKNPDVKLADGRTFTLRNPAVMTREISEIVSVTQGISFHMASQMALNPANVPDKFEVEALGKFDAGAREYYRIEKVAGAQNFRYMAPLYVEQSCLECHVDQGYKVGDVRGGITINTNIDEIEAKLRTNQFQIVVYGALVTVFVLALLFMFTRKLMRRLIVARKAIEEIAVRDPLTGIYNRRYVMERLSEELGRSKRGSHEFCCFIMDIDHFKPVNDKYGHLFGDEVLVEVVEMVTRVLRSYDVFGRFGGEEFIVLTPGLGVEESLALAERIRHAVKEANVNGIRVTISIGVSCYRQGDDTFDDIIRRADDAMYRAKREGRDCVRTA